MYWRVDNLKAMFVNFFFSEMTIMTASVEQLSVTLETQYLQSAFRVLQTYVHDETSFPIFRC